jgi:hypothetical protein
MPGESAPPHPTGHRPSGATRVEKLQQNACSVKTFRNNPLQAAAQPARTAAE